jgi:hypothetical protein
VLQKQCKGLQTATQPFTNKTEHKCHSVSRRASKCYIIPAHNRSTTFPAPIFTKITNALNNCQQYFGTASPPLSNEGISPILNFHSTIFVHINYNGVCLNRTENTKSAETRNLHNYAQNIFHGTDSQNTHSVDICTEVRRKLSNKYGN